MKLAVAREFKQDVLQSLAEPVRGGTRAMRALPAPFNVAVGLAPAPGRDFRLAVRAQTREALAHPALAWALDRPPSDVDVRVTGRVHALGGGPRRAMLALAPGASVAHPAVTAGTLGCFVSDASGGVGILSNNHVLADTDRGSLGDPVLSPGPLDGGGADDRIGQLSGVVPIRQAGNEVDAAVALLDTTPDPAGNAVDGVRLTGPLDDDEIADLVGEFGRVRKHGRTTGITSGTITAVELDGVAVVYDTGSFVFDRNIELEGVAGGAFSEGGDSGSVIHTSEGHCLGLLYAGAELPGQSGGVTYANPLHLALSALGVRLL